MTVTSKRTAVNGSQDKNGNRSYQVQFQVEQTDGGSVVDPVAMINQAISASPDAIPELGELYFWDGTTDLDSYCQAYDWTIPHGFDRRKVIHATAHYGPPDGIDPGRLGETDPLMWPTEYWLEWTEEQVVLDKAKNVEDLFYADSFPRAAGTLGPVVNACGVEYTEPLMKTIHYPILNCQKCYATLNEIIALNVAYQNTTNNSTFFGAAARTAKYLGTESGRIQKVGAQQFYVGITRVWFKSETWDRRILNNGWSHFQRPAAGGDTILYDADGKRVFFKNLIHDDPEAIEDDDETDPTTPCAEPLNLTLDGTLLGSADSAVYIGYRDLEEVSYSGIGIGG